MKSYFLTLPAAMLLFFSCTQTEENEMTLPEVSDAVVSATEKQYHAEAFEKGPQDWGYKIFDQGQLFINQPHIPALSGNKGFSSEKNALITAGFIIYKLESGLVPPTVTRDELDSLGVIN